MQSSHKISGSQNALVADEGNSATNVTNEPVEQRRVNHRRRQSFSWRDALRRRVDTDAEPFTDRRRRRRRPSQVWSKVVAVDSGWDYYYNKRTGETQWDDPYAETTVPNQVAAQDCDALELQETTPAEEWSECVGVLEGLVDVETQVCEGSGLAEAEARSFGSEGIDGGVSRI